MNEQTAALPAENTNNTRNLTPKKELIRAYSLIGKAGQSAPQETVIVRLYTSRSGDGASPVYCSLWVRGNHPSGQGSISLGGHGAARGYGYHKGSAALQAAIDSAGIKLAQPIDGVGDEAMREAMRAIATACGMHTVLIVEHA